MAWVARLPNVFEAQLSQKTVLAVYLDHVKQNRLPVHTGDLPMSVPPGNLLGECITLIPGVDNFDHSNKPTRIPLLAFPLSTIICAFSQW